MPMPAMMASRRGTLAKPAAPFTPSSISGLHAWWKADAITGLSDGGNIATWPDSGPNGYTLDQPFSRYAIYKTGIVNGLPVGRFSSSNARNATASSSLTSTTLFAVVRPTTTTGQQTIRGADASGGLQFRLSSGKVNLTKQGVAVIGTGATTLSTSTFSVVAATYVDTTSWVVYLNGASDGSGSHAQTLTAAKTTTVGANSLFGGEDFGGDIAEVIVYDSVLGSTDRSAVTAYLGTKYGITVV